MRTAIDTNILAALFSDEPGASEAAALLGQASREGGLVIAAPVFAELRADPRASEGFLDDFLAGTGVVVDFVLEESLWREAGRRFALYAKRRRKSGGGHPKRLLVDFLIGAHAELLADRLLTFDRDRYARDFPQLRLM
jgi:hypothetical protein